MGKYAASGMATKIRKISDIPMARKGPSIFNIVQGKKNDERM